MSPVTVPERGWYPDPRGAARTYRWWDGSAWTAELTDDPTDSAPTPAELAATAAGAEVELGTPVAASVPRIDPALTSAYRRREPAEPRGPRRADRIVAGVAVAVLLLAASLVVIWRSDGLASSTPLLTPPSPVPSTVTVGYDDRTREARIGDVLATMPGSPWKVAADEPDPATGLVTAGVLAAVDVHPKYDGTSTWSGAVLFGPLDPTLVRSGDGAATVQAVLAFLQKGYYDGVSTTVVDPTPSQVQAAPGRTVDRFQAELHYRVPKVPSTYDRVTILVVQPPAGTADPPVLWVSLRPEKSSPLTTEALTAALNTIKLG